MQDKLRGMSAALEEAHAELADVRHARASEASEHDEQVLLYMCPHTAIYVPSFYYMRVRHARASSAAEHDEQVL